MTPKEFLALCREQGYEGPATRASVKSWLDSEDAPEIELYDRKGSKLTFATIWPDRVVRKGITLNVAKNESEPDTVEVQDGSAPEPEMGEESAAPKNRVGVNTRKARGVEQMLTEGKAFRIGRPEVKAYQNKIARRGRTIRSLKEYAVFDDVERAEAAGATFRLAVAASNGITEYSQKRTDLEIVGKGALEGINSQGGALVPQDFLPEMIVLLNEYGAARQLCNFRTTARDTITLPRRTADPTVAWTGEAAAISDQDPAYGNVTVTAKALKGLMYISAELLNDSAISVADDIMGGFANGIAYKEDLAFFNGDGTSTYGGVTGFINAIGSAGNYAQATGSTWAAIVDADVQGALGLIPGYVWGTGNVKMTCTPAAFFNIINRISRGVGGVSYVESQAGIPRPVYNGYPVVYNNVMASATAISTKSVLIGDFDMAAKCIEVSGSLEFATSEHYRFANDQLTLRARERVGITVHDAGDSSTAGPVVALATDAS